MNRDFLKLKPLEGELKLSHKKGLFGLTVSTRELVLHKPHVNYYTKLEDIISITPYSGEGNRPLRIESKVRANKEMISAEDGVPRYNVYVRKTTVHNRSGLHTLGAMQFVIPIHNEIMIAIGQYGKWDIALET
jgi:hypothetical protein